MIFVTLLRIGSLNVFVLAGARFVAGSDTGTEAGAPPMTSRGIRAAPCAHGYKRFAPMMSRVAARAPRPVPLQ